MSSGSEGIPGALAHFCRSHALADSANGGVLHSRRRPRNLCKNQKRSSSAASCSPRNRPLGPLLLTSDAPSAAGNVCPLPALRLVLLSRAHKFRQLSIAIVALLTTSNQAAASRGPWGPLGSPRKSEQSEQSEQTRGF